MLAPLIRHKSEDCWIWRHIGASFQLNVNIQSAPYKADVDIFLHHSNNSRIIQCILMWLLLLLFFSWVSKPLFVPQVADILSNIAVIMSFVKAIGGFICSEHTHPGHISGQRSSCAKPLRSRHVWSKWHKAEVKVELILQRPEQLRFLLHKHRCGLSQLARFPGSARASYRPRTKSRAPVSCTSQPVWADTHAFQQCKEPSLSTAILSGGALLPFRHFFLQTGERKFVRKVWGLRQEACRVQITTPDKSCSCLQL